MIEKKQILKSAIDTFNKFGIKRVSVDDICFNLSISKKTFYHHYSEKVLLINDFIESEFLKLSEKFEALLKETNSPVELMVSYNQYILDEITFKNPAILFDLKHFYPENLRVYQRERDVLLRHFESIIERGIQSGHFRKKIDTKLIAELRLSQLEMFLLHKYPMTETLKRNQQQLLEHYVYGLLVHEMPWISER